MIDKEHAHSLLDGLGPEQLAAVTHLLELLADSEDLEKLTDEDRRIILESREYFRQGGQGLSFGQVLAECGFTTDQVRGTHEHK